MFRSLPYKFFLFLLLLTMTIACSPGTPGDPTVGSESHFLGTCAATSDCPADLACTCGICTIECSEDAQCTARGHSRCIPGADLASTCSESASLAEGICVAKCTDDAQCQTITPGTACTSDGWCEPRGWDLNDDLDAGDVAEDDTRDEGDDVLQPSLTIFDDLQGPSGHFYDYLGRIENRFYFGVSRMVQGTVTYYEPGLGWSIDPALTELVSANAGRWAFGGRRAIVVDGDTSYLFFGDRLFRSEDEGASWQALNGLPPIYQIRSFGADQGRLFLLTIEVSSQHVLWRSLDAGLSWERLDEFSYTELAVFPGLLVRYPGGHFSIDQGQTWQLHATCRNHASPRHWYAYGERFLYIGEDDVGEENVLVEFDPIEGCSPRYPSGLEAAQVGSLEELLVLDDRILGITFTGAVIRISSDLSSAEQVSLPGDLRPYPTHLQRLFDLGDDGLALFTNRGLMASVDDLQTWNFVGHHHSSPDWFIEVDGVVHAPGAGGVYAYDEGRWTFSERYSGAQSHPAGRSRLLLRAGRIFVPRSDPLSLYELLDGADEPNLLWQHPQLPTPPPGSEPNFISEVRLHEGRVFIASNRNFLIVPDEPEEELWWDQLSSPSTFDAVVPDSPLFQELLAGETAGGGVFVSDLTGANFELFGQGLLDPQSGHVLTVVAMVIFENHIYAATSLRGVWRANLDDGQWAPAHGGLPTAEDGDGALPVIGLYESARGLFATTTDAIYRLDGEAWTLVVDGFQGPFVDIGWPTVGLVEILL
ncbi:MAG: hypothetical protein ACNA8W_00325, partial [Bradymonadaceae bacterium]